MMMTVLTNQRWMILVVLAVVVGGGVQAVAVDPPLSEPNVLPIDYDHDGVALQGFVATPTTSEDGPFPAVIIIPDWDGVNFYEQIRATLIANTYNWVGFAADIYGANLHNVSDIGQRIQLATLYRSNSTLFANRIQAAVNVVKTLEQVDSNKIALLGFCFGGTGVLLYALEDVPDGITTIVSMHGGLTSIVNDTIGYSNLTTNANILVLSGGDDDTSTDIISLEYALNNATLAHTSSSSPNATTTHGSWEITRFDGIEHAWTVWMNEDYDEWADMRTWQRADQYLKEAFGEITYQSIEPTDCELTTKISAVNYTDPIDIKSLTGYVAYPDPNKWQYPVPAVIILPDWDGVNEYEQKRAILFANEGYIGFAADIYGSDLQMVENITQRIELLTQYTSNSSLYISRINAALRAVTKITYPQLDDEIAANSDSVALVGYCFGGTGVVQYAFNDGDGGINGDNDSGKQSFQVGVAYHGGLQTLPAAITNISMYMLIESGGDDAAHGNQTILEQALNDANAEWEISRYSGVVHGFTVWSEADDSTAAAIESSDSMVDHSNQRSMQQDMLSPYNVIADARSWMATMEILESRMPSVAITNGATTLSTDNCTVPIKDDTNTETNNATSSAGFEAKHHIGMIIWAVVTAVVCVTMQF